MKLGFLSDYDLIFTSRIEDTLILFSARQCDVLTCGLLPYKLARQRQINR
jgi:hypothetical protein